MQRGLNYKISSCNFIADWTIVMGKISIVGLALLLASWLQLTFPSIHINIDQTSFFQNVRLGRKVSFQDLTNTLGFKVAFSSLQ